MTATLTASEQLGDLRKRRQAIEQTFQGRLRAADVVERLEAEVDRPKVTLDLQRLDIAIKEAERAAETEREDRIAAIHKEYFAKKRQALIEFAKATKVAQAAAVKLQRLEVAEHELTNEYVDFFVWVDILPSDGRREGRLEQMIMRARAEGLFSDEDVANLS